MYIKTKEQAREYAINWQHKQSKLCLSWSEIIECQEFFIKLGKRFNLIKEFQENGII